MNEQLEWQRDKYMVKLKRILGTISMVIRVRAGARYFRGSWG
jgi:hypothetical protein